MSLHDIPKKKLQITDHPLAVADHSSDEDSANYCHDKQNKSENITSRNFKSSKNLQHDKSVWDKSQEIISIPNESMIDRWRNRLMSNFERYNSILHQALALSPFRRRILARNRTQSLTRGEFGEIEVNPDSRNSIELDQVVGILKHGPLSHSNGHNFLSVIMNRPTWCDHCGKYILGYYQHCLQCPLCLFTCHVICRGKVTLECPSLRLDRILGPVRQLNYETTMNAYPRLAISVLEHGTEKKASRKITSDPKDEEETASLFSIESEDNFKTRINSFNNNKHGLTLKLLPNSLEGSIRVHMNLFRPITCISAPPPNSDSEDESPHLHTYKTSFHLPRDTSKLVHVNDNTTADDVIELLLKKFCIANNPKAFALYHKSIIHDNVHVMRKLNGNELPLVLCLHWFYQGQEALESNKFILQEMDPGEIMWDSFSMPELDNFLTMLNREEEEHAVRIMDKFRVMKLHMERLMKELTGRSYSKTSYVLDML